MTCKDCLCNHPCSPTLQRMKRGKAEQCPYFKNKADFVEVDKISPCDVCAYNPPSSLDGKPCALCPAKKKGEIHNG